MWTSSNSDSGIEKLLEGFNFCVTVVKMCQNVNINHNSTRFKNGTLLVLFIKPEKTKIREF